jgi:hypothetical protein
MHLLDLLPPPGRTFPALLPKGPWTSAFDPSHGTAEQFFADLPGRGAAIPDQLQAAKELYVWRFPWFRGLSNGFARAADIHGGNGRFGVWVLSVLGMQGWDLLEEVGMTPMAPLVELLSVSPPGRWRDHADLLRLPPDVRAMLKDDHVEILGPRDVALDWLPRWLRCGLVVRGPVTVHRFPTELNCCGPVHLQEVRGLTTLQHLHAEGHQVHLENLPDLQRLEVAPGTSYLVTSCPCLETVTGHLDQRLSLSDLPLFTRLAVITPDLSGKAPDLSLERCPSLRGVEWPSGAWRWLRNLTVLDCPRLEALPSRLRVVRERVVKGCPLIKEPLP